MKLLFLTLSLIGTNALIAKTLGHNISVDTEAPESRTQSSGSEFKADGFFNENQSNTYRETNITHNSKVIYTHPNPVNSEDPQNNSHFDFPESAEKHRIIVYDLGEKRKLTEFGSVHSPRPVRFKVYVFDKIPEKKDWSGRMTFDRKALENITPVASKEDPRGVGYIKVKTQNPVTGRYVALVWEPHFQ